MFAMIRVCQFLIFFVLCGISCSAIVDVSFYGKLSWARTYCGQDYGDDFELQDFLTCTCAEKECKLASYYSSLQKAFDECKKCSNTCNGVAKRVSGYNDRRLRAKAAHHRCHRQDIKVHKLLGTDETAR